MKPLEHVFFAEKKGWYDISDDLLKKVLCGAGSEENG